LDLVWVPLSAWSLRSLDLRLWEVWSVLPLQVLLRVARLRALRQQQGLELLAVVGLLLAASPQAFNLLQ
jgi:hypothetical protein